MRSLFKFSRVVSRLNLAKFTRLLHILIRRILLAIRAWMQLHATIEIFSYVINCGQRSDVEIINMSLLTQLKRVQIYLIMITLFSPLNKRYSPNLKMFFVLNLILSDLATLYTLNTIEKRLNLTSVINKQKLLLLS